MEQDYNLKKWSKGCPNTGINCRRSSCGIEYVFIPAALGDDQEGSPVAPKNGSYNNAIVYYEATGNVYLYSSDGVPTRVEKNLDSIIAELQRELDDVEEALSEETSAREAADAAIEQEIEDLRNEPDVVDIVGTYADLLAYDTSDLGDKDIIRVLVDETHDDESTYYRWNKTPQTWTYIGAIDGYYTKGETDALLATKQDTLTFDSTPTANSTNPVTSGGIKTYVDEAPAFKPFPASVTTDGTTQQLMSSILALSPEVGTAYLGTVELSDMPAGLMQEEVEVHVYSDYVVYCIMRSTDVAPYAWWCASYNYQGWQPVDNDTTYTAGTNVQISNQNVISATDTTYTAGTGLDLTGTEFSIDNTVALKSEIPVVNDATLTIQKNSTDVGTFTANASSNSTINITVPTTAAEVSALPDSTKYAASISLTIDSSTYVVTAQLKDQDNNNIGSSQTIDLPLESVVVSGSYDSQTREVVLTLQGGSTIRFSVADLVSGLQSEITAQNKLSADLVDDSTTTNKFVTASDKTIWNGKQDALTAGSNISISGNTISATDTTYTAGTGLNLTGTQFSIDSTTVATQSDLAAGLAGKQDELTAGANITIDANNVISATGGGSSGVSDVQVNGTSVVSGGVADIGYSNASTPGVIKISSTTGTGVSSAGVLYSSNSSYSSYLTASDYFFISKGTLENVIDGKGLVDQTDLATKQDVLTAGSNIQINGSTISATDTTYSDFTGTDGTTAGAAGLVPAPAATDAGKFLKADGTWGTAGSAINVVQSTGLSTTDVMSQRAASLMVYKDPSSQNHIAIGNNANVGAVAGSYYTAVGSSSSATGASSLALGNSSIASGIYSVALSGSSATNRGEFAIGLRDPYGYNNSNYRLLTGLYDPQSDHDAATKGYVDSVTPTITLSTTDIGEGAALPANTLYGVYE